MHNKRENQPVQLNNQRPGVSNPDTIMIPGNPIVIDLVRIIGGLSREDIRLLYVTALELRKIGGAGA